MNDTWVTVSPKKHVKAMIQARPKRNSLLNSVEESNAGGVVHSSPDTFMPYPNPTLLGPKDIILANTVAFKLDNLKAPVGDPLDALSGGMEDANMDDVLNLQNFKDVEKSTDSAKRKRREEGEEASSRGPN